METRTVFQDPEKRTDRFIVTCRGMSCSHHGLAITADHHYCPYCGLRCVPWPLASVTEDDDDA